VAIAHVDQAALAVMSRQIKRFTPYRDLTTGISSNFEAVGKSSRIRALAQLALQAELESNGWSRERAQGGMTAPPSDAFHPTSLIEGSRDVGDGDRLSQESECVEEVGFSALVWTDQNIATTQFECGVPDASEVPDRNARNHGSILSRRILPSPVFWTCHGARLRRIAAKIICR
jgi:hypothetical protein